jgi:hypothetical protein
MLLHRLEMNGMVVEVAAGEALTETETLCVRETGKAVPVPLPSDPVPEVDGEPDHEPEGREVTVLRNFRFAW